MFPLSFGPVWDEFGLRELGSISMHKIDKCLPLCKIQFQVAFLDAAADCVECQGFFKVLLMSIMVAYDGFFKQLFLILSPFLPIW